MGLLFLQGLTCLLFLPSVGLISAAGRLEPGKPISVNQTLVSSSGIFALGFFFPSNSSPRRYAGIRYTKVPQTVVWIANREKPLLDTFGVLTIARDGNIVVLDAGSTVLWSSNVSGIATNTTAVLLDSGNLVLRGEGGSIWQSFDHPTDTFLPGIKLQSSFHSNITNRLMSWKGKGDPSPGSFSFGIDPRFSFQLIVWNGSRIYMRVAVWNGNMLDRTSSNDTTYSVYINSVQVDDEGFNLTSVATEGSAAVRAVLDSTGSYKWMVWSDNKRTWAIETSSPARPCDIYSSCGPYSICNDSSRALMCSCRDMNR